MKKEKKSEKKEERSLEEKVVRQLIKQRLTITTVESCTGGAVAACLVNVPGASEVLCEAYVTYSDEAKHRLAGVKNTTLEQEGAVSEKCAKEMAKGGAKTAGADVSLSVTGLAGPDGGTEELPVGTVFIGCTCKGKTRVKEFHFGGDRAMVREQAVRQALKMAKKALRKH